MAAMNDLLGSDLLYRRWDAPAGRPVLLLIHGMGAHSARWDFLAGYFAGRGFPSYAPELRGYGRTPERPRGHIDSLDVYERDILRLREMIEAERPGRPVFLVGESLGGLIAFNLACREPEKFAGQILISPAFKNGMKFPLSSYLTLAAFYLFNPKKTVPVPFTSAMCTRDEAYRKVMDANPDELRVSSLKTLMSTLSAQKEARRLAGGLRVPTLFLVPGNDLLIDERASRRLFQRLPLEDKTLLEYPEMFHALSIESGRERVFEDILNWIGKRG